MRITLDTNQLVKALMRPPGLATFLMAWEARRFKVIASVELLAEYERVLTHPAIAPLIYPELLRAFRSHLQQDIDIVAVPRIAPVCRDPDDDKVIATAIYGAVDYLVTEDDDLRTPAMVAGLAAAGIQIISISSLIRQLA
jgi:uncharacterized protein